jgi:hypothetical protein
MSEWQSRRPLIYLGYAYKYKDKSALHKALLFLGDVAIAKKDEETAANLYTVALEGFTHMDVHCSQAQCMICLGDPAVKHGDTSQAVQFWTATQPLFKLSLQATHIAQIDARLLTVEKAYQKAFLEVATLQAPGELVNEDKDTSEVEKVESVTNESSNNALSSVPM